MLENTIYSDSSKVRVDLALKASEYHFAVTLWANLMDESDCPIKTKAMNNMLMLEKDIKKLVELLK